MARKKSRHSKKNYKREQRDAHVISKMDNLLFPSLFFRDNNPPINDDKRYWKPDRDQRLKISGNQVVYELTDTKGTKPFRSGVNAKITFQDAKRVETCKRRKTRRAIMFSRKLRGKGSGAQKRRLTPDSKIKC